MDFPKTADTQADRREVRTRRAIRNALIALADKKDIANITITEIARVADINRKTFYAHYVDVHAVLDDIENELCGRMLKILTKYDDLTALRYDTFPVFNEITREIESDIDFYSLFVQTSSLRNLMLKITRIFKNNLVQTLRRESAVDDEILSFSMDFIAAGSLSVYEEWFKSSRRIPLEEVAKIISRLVSKGVNAVLDSAGAKV
jgi:AcrR family transcriptional regulator